MSTSDNFVPSEEEEEARESTSSCSSIARTEEQEEEDDQDMMGDGVRIFYAELRALGVHPPVNPHIGSVDVDLSELYYCVSQRGGSAEVSRGRQWSDVADGLGIAKSASTSRAYRLRVMYMTFLYAYEVQNMWAGTPPPMPEGVMRGVPLKFNRRSSSSRTYHLRNVGEGDNEHKPGMESRSGRVYLAAETKEEEEEEKEKEEEEEEEEDVAGDEESDEECVVSSASREVRWKLFHERLQQYACKNLSPTQYVFARQLGYDNSYRNCHLVQQRIAQPSTVFCPTWYQLSHSNIIFKYYVWCEGFQKAYDPETQRLVFTLPHPGYGVRIVDVLPVEVNDTSRDGSHFRPKVFYLTDSGVLYWVDLYTGEALGHIVLSTTFRFVHMNWNTPLRSIFAKSIQGSRIMLVVFNLHPFQLVAKFIVSREVFGRDLRDCFLRDNCLFTEHAPNQVLAFPFPDLVQEFRMCEPFVPSSGDDPPPITLEIRRRPRPLWSLTTRRSYFEFGGVPWHYIHCPRIINDFCVRSLMPGDTVDHGHLWLPDESIFDDYLGFYDNSYRIIYKCLKEITVYRLCERDPGAALLSPESEQRLPRGAIDFVMCTNDGQPQAQRVYVCRTCSLTGTTQAGVCTHCMAHCHRGHVTVDLGLRKDFVCDCGTEKFAHGVPCVFAPSGVQKPTNLTNVYGHNFAGLYCWCGGPDYGEMMVQCVVCDNWFHVKCIATEDADVEDVERIASDTDYLCPGCWDELNTRGDCSGYPPLLPDSVYRGAFITSAHTRMVLERLCGNPLTNEEQARALEPHYTGKHRALVKDFAISLKNPWGGEEIEMHQPSSMETDPPRDEDIPRGSVAFTTRGRRITRLNYQEDTHSILSWDYEDELDCLVIGMRGAAWIYRNTDGKFLKRVPLRFWNEDWSNTLVLDRNILLHLCSPVGGNKCLAFSFKLQETPV